MRGSSLLPRRFREVTSADSADAGWMNRHVTKLLQVVSRRACFHPIHTIVVIALLASTTYVGLLDGTLFDSVKQANYSPGYLDVDTLLAGGRNLRLGQQTGWRWQVDDTFKLGDSDAARHLALTTFVFPDSSARSPQIAPLAENVPLPPNSSARSVPHTPSLLAPISQDSSLAFAVPYDEISPFLQAVREIPDSSGLKDGTEQKRWIMKAARSPVSGSRAALRIWLTEAWTSFIDLLKHAETIDILIMVLGYLSMHLTFVSLFLSMRRLGSKSWLAATVLISGGFAFLFGLLVTTKLGVPINMVLLSEGLPFLVVTIGFEKPIILTKAVLSASLGGSSQSAAGQGSDARKAPPVRSIQDAIQHAVKNKGFEIVRDYCIEIGILVIGAASGVQGGLRQFCFLAAWILFFDCALLFTFYTTILCIKLEINRIKRHVALRKALEEDGITRRVAENVASSNDWPRVNGGENGQGSNVSSSGIFGKKVRASSVPKFKFLMVGGFVLVNVLNLCTIPFRSRQDGQIMPALAKLSNVLAPAPIDPFKVAENGLDAIYVNAKSQGLETVVTVLPPIKYKLEYPSVHYAEPDTSVFDIEYTDVVGGRVIESLLKSLDDPIISKWIIAALTLSLVLNGYLFNAARWSIKEPETEKVPEKQQPEPLPKPVVVRQPVVKADGSVRTREECEQMLKDKLAYLLDDEELIDLSIRGKIPGYALEKTMECEGMSRTDAFTRAVKIRRAVVSRNASTSATTGSLEYSKVPYQHYNYSLVHGACCENVIGYLPLPLGVAGPLTIDGQSFFIPMATTEGVLIASTSRGCKAINAGGGAVTVITGDGMTRGPCVGFPSLARAGAAKVWLDSEEGQTVMKNAFNSTSRFARLQSMKTALAGTYLYIRFKTTTGDAMGMNMISKGVEKALHVMATEAGFEDMATISVSGNFCTDKKPAAVNWIDGRGKSVVAEAVIPGDVVKSVLKSNVDALVELNISKNLIGSAMAGSVGGFNAHASNIVTALFLATGQDPAQNVESSNCITIMKNVNGNLHISVSMPSIEVGTIGGGTILEAQSAMLELLGVRGSHPTTPGDNARRLARIVGAAVLAGELSLCSALAAGHLVRAHMAHNRAAPPPTRSMTPVSAAVATTLTDKK
ncbi:3-hydroxy-3-methylglutaryl-coenzyme A (HMG-CoA) reductase isozyme [Coccidioides posadasii str. Silveira]|uniref:3-hydroxy-3-methylglutaryl coenzyme A reductase n=3 Tax=Coccidioides posadasii TaxID=199306 RepID=E9D927_COCPS|nr:3-hydroxy-3-methylglutaryl-coenzyme A reductase, putative [Coccidioides posadasii C735 delta SOWgp]EER29597.1 3-hydroxy-3-methylglutaryl-coenzyme A reductase, putative [Coccidioides posadasii C735 delta SOWgp]EFW17061.1 3-hydroxy-3-methylglutaryl-coenzyme A reductase [Coccidioides posadasii str. Silveira]KMM69973.1 3-hydroxy-3-methylglutaryl-coenzyme A reductase [Coccidioides posadasii RMSCC 3488]QVM09170.1 3-hydroxy-3-methylglutaryl-coenzyme A (HMG-CoA) reductase isozyme [Coccidioides posad|eukprot:XP_003071742.1 3-hydroxy-3-methylglutaryl-coenzyme A reductase, putative [Coccidioides posadasii C735 delta SOWgp]